MKSSISRAGQPSSASFASSPALRTALVIPGVVITLIATARDESTVRPLLKLRLYVATPTFESTAAIAQVHSLLQKLGANYSLEVLEVAEHREQALADGVPLTPLLLRLAPHPIQRIAVPAANVAELEKALLPVNPPPDVESHSADDAEQRQFELTLPA